MPARADITRRGVLAAGAATGLAAFVPAAAWGAERLRSRVLDVPATAWTRGGGRQTGVLKAPARFELVGVRGRGLAAAGLELRARRAGGAWSPWTALGLGREHAPDRPRVEGASDPVWTGGSDELQLRARGRTPGGLRATFITVPRSVRTPDAHAARLRAVAAQAGGSGPPTIIPRSQWGGDALPPKAKPQYGDVQLAFVHHTVNANDYGPEDSAGIVLAICKYHRDSNGWNDIGYNLLVDQYGQVFEGRAGGIDAAVIGAQAQGWNSHSTGIATLGTFETVRFPEAGMSALARLIAYKLSLHGVPVTGTVDVVSAGGAANRYAAGKTVTFDRISGHRDGCSTTCPGAALYGQLPALRARASGAAGAVASTPKLTVAPAAAEVAYGEVATFAGRLADPAGGAIAGARVTLTKLGSNGKTYVPLLATTTEADGTWRISLPWRRAAAVRAQASTGGATVRSSPVTVALTPVLTLGRTPGRVLAGRSVPVSGAVRPGQAVAIKVEREATPGRYVLVRTVPMAVTGTRFSGSVPLYTAGLYRLTAKTRLATKARPVTAPAISVRAVRSAGDVGTGAAPLAP